MADAQDKKPSTPPPAPRQHHGVQESEVGKSILAALASDANQIAVAAVGGAVGSALTLGAKKVNGKVHRDPPPDIGQPRTSAGPFPSLLR